MRTIVCSVLGYFFLLLTVRVMSRRPGGQLTPFEFVLVFLIGGVIILATVGDDHSVTNCVTAIMTIGLMHRMVAAIKARNPRIGALVDGTPLMLIDRGEWQTEIMGRMRLQDTDIMAAARTKNIGSLDDIEYAILERNGSISILKKRGSPESQ